MELGEELTVTPVTIAFHAFLALLMPLLALLMPISPSGKETSHSGMAVRCDTTAAFVVAMVVLLSEI
jgi:hypothetical protein